MSKVLCAPAKAGAAAGAVAGVIVWLLVSFVPAFRDGVPQPVTDLVPFAVAWAGHVAGAWLTPHPPVPAQGQPPDAPVTPVAG